MKLITKEIAKKIPALYATDGVPAEQRKVPLKLFNPTGAGTYYVLELDPETNQAFGYVTGFGDDELGYIDINELAGVRLRFGLGIERDTSFDPNTTLADVINGKVR